MNFANDQQVIFPFMSFTTGLESVDGFLNAKIVAQSSVKICGGMKAVDRVRSREQMATFRRHTILKACESMCCLGR